MDVGFQYILALCLHLPEVAHLSLKLLEYLKGRGLRNAYFSFFL
jgi:hypothetical protein